MSFRRFATLSIFIVLSGFSTVGCSKKIWITQYPPFYRSDLKNVAVVGFRNATGVRGADLVVGDALATALMANGTYRIYNRNDLQLLLDESDRRSMLTGEDAAALAKKFAKRGKVQAILSGTVTAYSATSHSQRKQQPVMAWDPVRKRQVWTGAYNRYTWTRNEANVQVAAALLRTDGTTIYATPTPAQYRAWAEGSPPKADPQACLSTAVQQVVHQLVRRFAITRLQIKVSPKDFRTASDYYDGKWAFTNNFSISDQKAYFVVKLPAVCDRNRFRVTIIRKGARKDLVSMNLLWSKAHSATGRGLQFSPRDIAARGGGSGTYVIKFYSGPEPVMKHEFRIR